MKRIIGVLLFLFVLVGIGALVVYWRAGYRDYLRAAAYVQSHPLAQAGFYGDRSGGRYGGILAGVWHGGIWLWTGGGLHYFSVKATTGDSVYVAVMVCRGVVPVGVQDIPDSKLQRIVLDNLMSWEKLVRVGDFVTVSMDTNAPQTIAKISGADYWSFMYTADWKTQCEH